MSSSKLRLRAVPAEMSVGFPVCSGCRLFDPAWMWDCVNARPANCCNYDGNGQHVIFKEVQNEPVRNPA